MAAPANSVWIGYFGAGQVTWDGSTVTFPGTVSATKYLAGDGTAAAPSYSFASDPDTGIYRISANVGGISGGGTAVAYWTSSFFAVNTLGFDTSSTDVLLSRGGQNNLALAAGDSMSIGGAAGAATTATKLIKKVTGIADAVATDVITVTVPNANHAASIEVTLLSSNGSTDAFESARAAIGLVVLARTTGVATVATAITLTNTGIATVGGGATHTLAYGVSGMSGAVGATQTFTIQVTINDTGNVGSNQCVVLAEVVNAEATGVTIA